MFVVFRAEDGPTCIILHPLQDRPDRSRFIWLLNMDVKVQNMHVLWFIKICLFVRWPTDEQRCYTLKKSIFQILFQSFCFKIVFQCYLVLFVNCISKSSLCVQGWLPQSLVNTALPRAQADFTKHLRRRLATQHPETKRWWETLLSDFNTIGTQPCNIHLRRTGWKSCGRQRSSKSATLKLSWP